MSGLAAVAVSHQVTPSEFWNAMYHAALKTTLIGSGKVNDTSSRSI